MLMIVCTPSTLTFSNGRKITRLSTGEIDGIKMPVLVAVLVLNVENVLVVLGPEIATDAPPRSRVTARSSDCPMVFTQTLRTLSSGARYDIRVPSRDNKGS